MEMQICHCLEESRRLLENIFRYLE